MDKKLIIGLAAAVIIVLCIGGYFGLYYYSLSKVSISKMAVTEVNDVGLSGFTVKGYVRIHNGGVMAVRINGINYSITLKETDDKISEGSIEGQQIPAKKDADFTFSQRITWSITAKTALKALTTGKLIVVVDGTVSVGEYFTNEFTFSQEMNLVDYIKGLNMFDLL